MAEFPPDDELFDFDTRELAAWDGAMADRLLVQEPVLYRNHLAIARTIQQPAGRMEKDHADLGEDFNEGYQTAAQDIVAHLRLGDFVPGRALYEEQR